MTIVAIRHRAWLLSGDIDETFAGFWELGFYYGLLWPWSLTFLLWSRPIALWWATLASAGVRMGPVAL